METRKLKTIKVETAVKAPVEKETSCLPGRSDSKLKNY